MNQVRQDLIERIKALDLESITEYDQLPNLVKFYKRFTASHNKATITYKPLDNGFIVEDVTDNISDIIGYSPEDLIGKNFFDFKLAKPGNERLYFVRNLIQLGEVVVFSSIIKHKHGGEVYTKSMIYKDKDTCIEFMWRAADELFF